MLNERLANTAMFCGNDIDSILECTAHEISEYMDGHELELMSANVIGRIFLENVEFYLKDAVNNMQKMRS